MKKYAKIINNTQTNALLMSIKKFNLSSHIVIKRNSSKHPLRTVYSFFNSESENGGAHGKIFLEVAKGYFNELGDFIINEQIKSKKIYKQIREIRDKITSDKIIREYQKLSLIFQKEKKSDRSKIYLVNQEKKHVGLILKKFSGETLKKVIETQKPSTEKILLIFYHIFIARYELEKKVGGLVHLDLNPNNILIDIHNNYKAEIIDFGAAIIKDEEDTLSELNLHYITPELFEIYHHLSSSTTYIEIGDQTCFYKTMMDTNSRLYHAVSIQTDFFQLGLLLMYMLGAKKRTFILKEAEMTTPLISIKSDGYTDLPAENSTQEYDIRGICTDITGDNYCCYTQKIDMSSRSKSYIDHVVFNPDPFFNPALKEDEKIIIKKLSSKLLHINPEARHSNFEELDEDISDVIEKLNIKTPFSPRKEKVITHSM
jgi:serine/threonine protein kinase